MGGEQKLQVGTAGIQNLFGVCEHFHAFVNGIDASRDLGFGALDLNGADAAGADLVNVFQITEGQDIDSHLACCFKDCSPGATATGILLILS